ncbi:DUF4229 domain-containing protein [Curtobacterium sp. ISL-83]|uniref:DUF4229 domain-containing protein n=1 Tax=Curtobacterium sp. ISL-83 TaxID=2819145 RepID=UPI001BECD070|nr:DUF4229 domain-containing protein [Curtobacterium sp. ISL-83]MBT2503378.1 DUF4229 domain-containing protein [Curtobacterium sp. ISL-83]
MKAWLIYTAARLGIFAVALAVFLVIGFPWYWATIVAALVGLLVSYIALPKLRADVASSLANRRVVPERDEDSDFEDDFVDAADTPAPGTGGSVAPPVSDAERHRSAAELRRDED